MKVGIVGYGKMGRNIFTLFSDTSMAVIVLGRDATEMDRQNRRIERRLARAASTGMLVEEERSQRLARLRFTASWHDLKDCDLIIETIKEDLDLKIETLRKAEAVISPAAVLTTNTSSLSITRLAECLREPARFAGFHFFHPPQLTSIVEIITAQQTAPHVTAFLCRVSQDIGRTPLIMKDRAGSCINVPLAWWVCEALYILEQGLVPPSRLEAMIARYCRVGPLEMLDTGGIPLFTRVLRYAIEGFAFDLTVPELCDKLIRDGRFGRYANRGIYLYRDGKPADDAQDYYHNPTQTHSAAGARMDEEGLRERLLCSVYFGILTVAALGLGSIADLCLGVQDLIGLTIDPLTEMRTLGSAGLRKAFGRLQDEVGPRYDCRPLEGIMAELDDR